MIKLNRDILKRFSLSLLQLRPPMLCRGRSVLAYPWEAVSPGWVDLHRRLLAVVRKKYYYLPCLSVSAGRVTDS